MPFMKKDINKTFTKIQVILKERKEQTEIIRS